LAAVLRGALRIIDAGLRWACCTVFTRAGSQFPFSANDCSTHCRKQQNSRDRIPHFNAPPWHQKPTNPAGIDL
jgi:hypothetical protein